MPVLQWVDIGIGYAFSMVLLATLVGAFVGIIQTFLRTRAYSLEDGLAAIIANLEPGSVSGESAKALAQEVTKDTTVKSKFWAAEVIQREEFVMILLRKAIAKGNGSELWNGIQKMTNQTPDALLNEIERKLVEFEQADPNAPSYQWKVKAMHAAGASPLAGKVFAWYDNTMRRVEDAVNFQGRTITMILAFLLCFGLKVDSVDLLGRLSRDDAFRNALVERAIEEVKKAPEDAQGKEAENVKAAINQFTNKANESKKLLDLKPLTPIETNQIPGIVLSGVMVSLGTAFWWGLLNKLIGLKSTIQEKADSARAMREASIQPKTNQ